MTWSEFNIFCRQRMGDFYSVGIISVPFSLAVHADVILINSHPLHIYTGDAKLTAQAALADGMTEVRRRLRAERTRAERN